MKQYIVCHISTKLWLFEKKVFFQNFYSHPFLAHRSIIIVSSGLILMIDNTGADTEFRTGNGGLVYC